MEIVDDLLVSDEEFQVQFEETRNAGPEMVKLKYLVIHYTAGLNFQAAIDTFRNEEGPRRVSSHIVIGRNGEIVQMVPFNEQAWHSGGSYWEGDFLLNQYSIGIELDNEGKLIHHNGQWTFKRKYAIPENEYQISEYWKEYG